jgi:hypothetical protein
MSPKLPPVHTRTWVATALVSVALSAVAVAIVRSSSPTPLLAGLSHLAEYFASPGELLWWATFGGAFAGFPSGVSGHLLWVIGTALFWFLAVAPLIATLPRLRQWFGARR